MAGGVVLLLRAKGFIVRNSKVEKLAKGYIEEVKKVLALAHFDITLRLRYRKKEEGWCKVLGEYEEAVININPERMKKKKILRKAILHEMIHVLQGKFEVLGGELADYYDGEDNEEMKKAYVREKEALVTHYTRVLYPLIWKE